MCVWGCSRHESRFLPLSSVLSQQAIGRTPLWLVPDFAHDATNGRLIFIHLQCWEVLPFCRFQRQRCIKILCPKDPESYTPLALKTAEGQHLPALEVYKNQSPNQGVLVWRGYFSFPEMFRLCSSCCRTCYWNQSESSSARVFKLLDPPFQNQFSNSREVAHGVGADGVGVKFPIFAVNCSCSPLSTSRMRQKRRKTKKNEEKRRKT